MGQAVSGSRVTGSDSRVIGGAASGTSVSTGIRTEVDDRGIARITIDRPERMNALNGDASQARRAAAARPPHPSRRTSPGAG